MATMTKLKKTVRDSAVSCIAREILDTKCGPGSPTYESKTYCYRNTLDEDIVTKAIVSIIEGPHDTIGTANVRLAYDYVFEGFLRKTTNRVIVVRHNDRKIRMFIQAVETKVKAMRYVDKLALEMTKR